MTWTFLFGRKIFKGRYLLIYIYLFFGLYELFNNMSASGRQAKNYKKKKRYESIRGRDERRFIFILNYFSYILFVLFSFGSMSHVSHVGLSLTKGAYCIMAHKYDTSPFSSRCIISFSFSYYLLLSLFFILSYFFFLNLL